MTRVLFVLILLSTSLFSAVEPASYMGPEMLGMTVRRGQLSAPLPLPDECGGCAASSHEVVDTAGDPWMFSGVYISSAAGDCWDYNDGQGCRQELFTSGCSVSYTIIVTYLNPGNPPCTKILMCGRSIKIQFDGTFWQGMADVTCYADCDEIEIEHEAKCGNDVVGAIKLECRVCGD